MKHSRYRHRVRFERRSSSQDAIGQQIDSWTTLGEDFAEIAPVSGREFFARSGEQASVSTKVTIRYRPSLDVRPDDRILARGAYYDINAVLNQGMKDREVVFMCSTFKPDED